MFGIANVSQTGAFFLYVNPMGMADESGDESQRMK
jgi:hypothetical protein